VTQASDTPGEITIQDRPVGPGLGEKLRIGREQKSLSIERVSEALHLDETIIRALEQESFEALGAPVYIRGHLKAYAQLLGLSPAAIASEYQDLCDPEPVVVQALRQPKAVSVSVSPGLWAGGALVILLGLLLGLYVLFAGKDFSDTVSVKSGVDAQVADEPAPIGSVTDNAVQDAGEVSVSTMQRIIALPETVTGPLPPMDTTEVDDVDIGAPPVELPMPMPIAALRLVLHFNQESWVEISDANQRLLFGLQREGYRREISGEPPFNLLIGNARGVDLTINDEPFEVPASRVNGKVARFTITGEDFE
jgi:cytoskeleton protein RodZ